MRHSCGVPSEKLALTDYLPRPRIVLPQTHVDRAATPAIDAHNHLGRWLTPWVTPAREWMVDDVGALLDVMDRCNVEAVVNLDGRDLPDLEANLDRYDRAHPGRFHTFVHVDWEDALRDGGGGERQAALLARARDAGAAGVKVWKDLGLYLDDPAGTRVLPDDPRLAPVFAAAGELGLPVLIHTADPVAFWDPVDARNERYEELHVHPEWSFAGPEFPSFERLLEALETVVASHPGTTFIGAHVGCHPENLAEVGRMLDTYPNLTVDVSARMAELGRQPRAARALILRHPDRVLFGTDEFPPDALAYRRWFRFLETADEHFPYSDDPDRPPPQGRWAVSALDLPDDVLERVYRLNARRVLRLDRT
jgi:predicted TIM-barrel fold metal-dependent hydrolase